MLSALPLGSMPRIPAIPAVLVAVVAIAVVGLPAPSSALAAAPPPSASALSPHAVAPVTPFAVRGGRGFRARPRTSRPLTPSQRAARQRNTGRTLRNVGRVVLRALGIAFLLNLLFGIGAGGSPLGLLLLFGLIALVVMSRRRRRHRFSY